ncbi:MAG: hypothetical protein QXQ71_06430, partial [Desulfurococcaceae archaeon]
TISRAFSSGNCSSLVNAKIASTCSKTSSRSLSKLTFTGFFFLALLRVGSSCRDSGVFDSSGGA